MGITVVYCFHQNNHLARRSSFAKIGCRGSRQRQQVRLAWPSPLTWTTSTPISKPSGFWGSRSNGRVYPLALLTSSPTDSSPGESSNLPRPPSAIPTSYLKPHSRHYPAP